jgi:hypothetical protein
MKNEQMEVILNYGKHMKSLSALVVLNDKVFLRPKKENYLQPTVDIFFPIVETTELIKIDLICFNLVTGNESLKFIFSDEKTFDSWWKTFEDLTNAFQDNESF